MKAKWAGNCLSCGARFPVGAECDYDGSRKGMVSCPSCKGGRRAAPSYSAARNTAPAVVPTSLAAHDPQPAARAQLLQEQAARAASVTPASVALALGLAPGALPAPRGGVPACTLPLDSHQLAVVAHRTGEALVAAGAGSGKSTVLVERVAALVADGVVPETLLTLVFNKDAAESLRQRLVTRLGPALGARTKAATFHGWAYALLKAWYPGDRRFQSDRLLGVGEHAPNAERLARDVMKLIGVKEGEPKDFLAASGVIRESLVDLTSPGAVEAIDQLFPTGKDTHGDTGSQLLLDFSRQFQAIKAREEVVDFPDMLVMVTDEIRQRTTRALHLRGLYSHVQQDEAQDANRARWCIALWLGEQATSLMSVGDARQAIYKFTGAMPELFAARIPAGAKLLTLPINRRSTPEVVELGNAIAEGRDWNLGGSCSAEPTRASGPAVAARCPGSPGEEARQFADDVVARVAAGMPLVDTKGKSNYAAIYRTRAQSAQLEAALMARRLPCRVLGSPGGVWETNIGRDIRAYLVAAEGRVDESLSRIGNKPFRYLKSGQAKELAEKAKASHMPLFEALDAERHRGLDDLLADLQELAGYEWADRCEGIKELLLKDLAQRAREASKGAEKAGAPDEDKVEMVTTLCEAAMGLGSLKAIENQIEAAKQVKASDPAVELSTIHKSKGLEWHSVMVVGAKEGLLPHAKASDTEEERRLFYVACTRAKQVLQVTYSGTPSPFLVDVGLVEGDGSGPGGGGGEHAPGVGEQAPAKPYVAELPAPAPQSKELCLCAVVTSNKADLASGYCPSCDQALNWASETSCTQCGWRAVTECPLHPAAQLEAKVELPKLTLVVKEATKMVAPAAVAPVVRKTALQEFPGEEGPALAKPTTAMGQALQAAGLAPKGLGAGFETAALNRARGEAARLTAMEPRGSGDGAGSRFVEVQLRDVKALLAPLGFSIHESASFMGHQEVLAAPLWSSKDRGEQVLAMVYTSIPRGGSVAAGLGEDSIKVSLVFEAPESVKPLMAKQTYVCRTRGWRETLISRLEALNLVAGALRPCNSCGGPCREVTPKDKSKRTFWGCCNYPNCNGAAVGQ